MRCTVGSVAAAVAALVLPTGLPAALVIYEAFLFAVLGGVVAYFLPQQSSYRIGRLEPRRINRKNLVDLAGAGAMTGVVGGILAGSVSRLSFAYGYGYGFLLGFGTGFLYGAVARLFAAWQAPAPATGMLGFTESYRFDRSRALVSGSTCAAVLALFAGALCTAMSHEVAGLVAAALIFVAAFAVVGSGPSQALALSEIVFLVQGRAVRFMPLLTEAHERQVLRQAGPVYQFRHSLLQDLSKEQKELDA